MLPDTFKDKSCILMLSIKELIGVIAKDYPLRDFQIIVADNDIITENSIKNNYRRDIKYESNYDNIEFLPSIIPQATVLNHIWDTEGDGRSRFEEAYVAQLQGDQAASDITCIIDMTLHRKVPIIILYAPLSIRQHIPDVLRQYLMDAFGIKAYDVVDLMDDSVDVLDIGDINEIEKNLDDSMKLIASSESEEDFYNYMTDSLLGKYRGMLEKKTEEQLRAIASSKSIFLRRGLDREGIIDAIINKLSKRERSSDEK